LSDFFEFEECIEKEIGRWKDELFRKSRIPDGLHNSSEARQIQPGEKRSEDEFGLGGRRQRESSRSTAGTLQRRIEIYPVSEIVA
jgi:hypothetical protein